MSVVLKLVNPNKELLFDYLNAIKAGFINMQLGFGNDDVVNIEAQPEKYFEKISGIEPFFVSLEGVEKTFSVTKHEILWITDGFRFIGSIALRYSGDPEILELYAGNRGMAIHPALRGQGFGKRTWKDTLPDVIGRMKKHGLGYMYVTCNPNNKASSHLIELAGGQLMERSEDVLGQGPSLRYRIDF